MRTKWIGGLVTSLSLAGFVLPALADGSSDVTSGQLRIIDDQGRPAGACPLKHTDVEAEIAGYVARTRVRQVFENPLDVKIEAVYVFPLPQDAAVDDMVMLIGDRRIVGQIKPREQARAVYEAAKAAGHVASLLEQERPNIFTQSVANIEPGVKVVIEISYVETLKFEDGVFEFVFPMVVGPRYMPGQPTGKQGTGWAPDTTQVPDASRISPPVTPPGTRAGHDISVKVTLDAGMEIAELKSVLHKVKIDRPSDEKAVVTLKDEKEIPNKDFILRYRTATERISDAFLIHRDKRGTFFTLILQPPKRVAPEQAVPKEMIFVIDRSGSMSGFPIEKAKETMRLCIMNMNPNDTFNLLSFSGGTGRCFDKPVPNTRRNREKALKYLADLYGSGGTEMMKAIKAALQGERDPQRVRIVCFMTDGYIGNDFAIIDAVKKNSGTARVFSFGIGNGVNRFLLDGMAHAGRGEVEYVTLRAHADQAAQRFYQRIRSPVLTDIEIDWGDLPVDDVYPKHYMDLFSSKPIMIHGRLNGDAEGTITLRGRTVDGPFERTIAVSQADASQEYDSLASLWARAKVKELMMKDYAAMQRGQFPEDLKRQVTQLGVEYRLMTQFTSFVAVEEMTVTVGGEPKTIAVPVEMPEGVSYEGVFGERKYRGVGLAGRPMLGKSAGAMMSFAAPAAAPAREMSRTMPQSIVADQAETVDARRPPKPENKLAQPLRDLAEKVAKQGKNGNLTVNGIRVIDYKVDVMIYLSDLSDKTLKALKDLGFVRTGRSKAIRLLIGAIDVRKLTDLADISAVVRVEPVG